MEKDQNLIAVMNAMMFSGVDRDSEEGVPLRNTYLFCRGGKKGLTTHLYGDTRYDTWQVCSPIRSIEVKKENVIFITRSYNKYVVKKTDFIKTDSQSIETLTKLLGGWLGSDKIIKIFDWKKDSGQIPLFEGEATEFEKKFYGS